MTDGRTALELTPRGPAAVETAALWKNIKTWLQPPAKSPKKEKARA
jgi:chromosome partitioning protein